MFNRILYVRSLAGWTVAIIGYYLWFQMFYNLMRFGSVFPYADIKDMTKGVLLNFIPIACTFILNILIVLRFVKIRNLKAKISVDLMLSVLGSLAVDWLYLGIIGQFRDAKIDWAGTILNDIIILLGVEMVYYFRHLSKSRQETEDARRQALQYQYDALVAQVNPHFLFNSLNLLHSLVSIDTDKSKIFIQELAIMYRYIMAKQNCDRVKVGEELVFLESYISVLRMRYNNKFEVNILEAPSPEKEIIPFTMQLLIENVTKHNVISSKCPMVVSITSDAEGITVSNPIHPRASDSPGKMGLRYLYKLYSANGKTFSVNNDGHTFIARVPYLE